MAWHLPPLIPHFHAALRDVEAENPESRIRAAQRLSLAEGDESEPARTALTTLSRDPHPGVRATAVAGLAEVGGPAELEAVLERLTDPSAEVRELSVMAVGRIGGERAEGVLREALTSEAAEVRFQAVGALADLLGEAALGDLVSCIEDEDPQVRAQVAEALAGVCTEHTRGHLAGLLHDPEKPVRREAALGLARMGDPRSEPELVAAVNERDRLPEVCLALGPLASARGRAALGALYERILLGPTLRLWAAAGLYLAGDPRGVQGLRWGLGRFRASSRNCSVDLIGRVAATELSPDIEALAHKRRGADPGLLAETLIALAEAGADVDGALGAMAKRDDEGGEAVRRYLGRHESTAIRD